MDTGTKIILKSGKEQSVMRRHPWIFSGAIREIIGNASEGDLVNVYSDKDEFLATGHYAPGSIAIRIISFTPAANDANFWEEKLRNAWEYRKSIGLAGSPHTNVYRLFHAEGDGLPGLVIDYYNGHVVIQMHSLGMYRNLDAIVNALQRIYEGQLKTIYNKSASSLPFKSQAGKAADHFITGDAGNTIVTENDLKFEVDWLEGQKTGFFIDQRDNRQLLRSLAKDRDVLNMFCYTGGFSVYALEGQARMVHSVDSSAKAVELVNRNVALNFKNPPHEAYATDAFRFMDKIRDKYDMIILDPPAFAKHQNVLSNALQGYKRLNQVALEQIRRGGILVTFSCSQAVSRENFRKSVFVAACNARRNVRILHQLSQPGDHPVNIFHPEGEYLKGLVLYVE